MSRLDTGYEAQHSNGVDLLALAAEECAHFENCEVFGAAPEIRGDARLLRRLIRNLIENAFKHGKPPVEVQIAAAEEQVSLAVVDRGNGIASSERENVFQPFYRAPGKQNVSGYGLGLPLVKQIAERAPNGAAITYI